MKTCVSLGITRSGRCWSNVDESPDESVIVGGEPAGPDTIQRGTGGLHLWTALLQLLHSLDNTQDLPGADDVTHKLLTFQNSLNSHYSHNFS